MTLTLNQEIKIPRLVARASGNLKSMDFAQRQKLLRMLVEEVVYTPGQLVVKTIIPLNEPLYPIPRGGLRG